MYGKIYLRRNRLENKDYVGQTTQQGDLRWKQHIADAIAGRTTCSFSAAILKFGPAAFDELILATAKEQEELDLLEILFIEALKTTNSVFGYNDKDGGNGGKLSGSARGRAAFKARERVSRLSQLRPKTINNLAFCGDIYEEQKKYIEVCRTSTLKETCKICCGILEHQSAWRFCSKKCYELYEQQVKLFNMLVPQELRSDVMQEQQLYFKHKRIYKNSLRKAGG